MSSSPDILQELITRFASMAWSTASESTVLRFIWSCQIIEVLANREKYFEVSGDCTVIPCAFTFCTVNDFGLFSSFMVQFEIIKHNISIYTPFICAAFKSRTEYNNVQRFSAPATVILTIMSSSFHCFKFFGDVISSLSSHCAISMDIPDPLSLPFFIVHCFRQIIRSTPISAQSCCM